MNSITVRRMDFYFPDDIDQVYVKDDPGLSYFFRWCQYDYALSGALPNPCYA